MIVSVILSYDGCIRQLQCHLCLVCIAFVLHLLVFFCVLRNNACKLPIHFESRGWVREIDLHYVYVTVDKIVHHFLLIGRINKQNCRTWSEANPKAIIDTPLHPQKVTAWCALLAIESLVYISSKMMTLRMLKPTETATEPWLQSFSFPK